MVNRSHAINYFKEQGFKAVNTHTNLVLSNDGEKLAWAYSRLGEVAISYNCRSLEIVPKLPKSFRVINPGEYFVHQGKIHQYKTGTTANIKDSVSAHYVYCPKMIGMKEVKELKLTSKNFRMFLLLDKETEKPINVILATGKKFHFEHCFNVIQNGKYKAPFGKDHILQQLGYEDEFTLNGQDYVVLTDKGELCLREIDKSFRQHIAERRQPAGSAW